jgi:hypothetical protein
MSIVPPCSKLKRASSILRTKGAPSAVPPRFTAKFPANGALCGRPTPACALTGAPVPVYSLAISSAFVRTTFGGGVLRKLPACGFLLYQRASRLLLPELLLTHYTESDKGAQVDPDPHRPSPPPPNSKRFGGGGEGFNVSQAAPVDSDRSGWESPAPAGDRPPRSTRGAAPRPACPTP